MHTRDDGSVVWEMDDSENYNLIGGPFDGQTRSHFPYVATEESEGFAEPYPFEAARWQIDPTRKTKCAIYKWNSNLNAFEYNGDKEYNISGFTTVTLGENPSLDELKPL